MERDDIQELHYITPISNVASIMAYGILSHKAAKKLVHNSVASQEVQERRTKKMVPGGRPLHDYANLYFCARNPMLYKRRAGHSKLCILIIDARVLDLPGVVVASQNAASDYVIFAPCPKGLRYINKEKVFADNWIHPNDIIREWEHKSVKCAEVLIPECVKPRYVIGAYVSCEEAKRACEDTDVKIPLTINPHLFFR